MRKLIPNTLTCGNLISGCIAAKMAFEGNYTWALTWIVIGAVFDFFDGFSARMLKVSSPIGKELDSLADDITFGFAPSAVLYTLLSEMIYPEWLSFSEGWLPYTAFIMAAFSGLRLAKFNLDTRQSLSFIGLPTPANALLWASVASSFSLELRTMEWMVPVLVAGMLVFSWLLMAEIPLFALKFKDFTWKRNKEKFVFLGGCVLLLALFQFKGIAACILWYILLSVFIFLFHKKETK